MLNSEKKTVTQQTDSSYAIAMRVSKVSILVNLVLSIVKFLAGLLASSGAMISDAVHSASDVLSTFVVIIGVKIAGKKSDHEHPYGHERYESVSAILLAGLLIATGLGIGMNGIKQIMQSGEGIRVQTPGRLALIAAVVSLVVKEWMFWYTRSAAIKINSGALMADAWHHRSDALSSVGAFVGILGARMGYPVLDPIASVVICGFILKAAWDIFKDATDKMIDRACDEETEKKIREITANTEGVIKIDLLRTRLFGSKMYVDVEISADENLSLKNAHSIAENVHHVIEDSFPNVKHCMVHVNPSEDKTEK